LPRLSSAHEKGAEYTYNMNMRERLASVRAFFVVSVWRSCTAGVARCPPQERTHCVAMYKCALWDFCVAGSFVVWGFVGHASPTAILHTLTTWERGEIAVTENEVKQLEKIREKMAQMKERERAIISRDKTRQRKERTRRLIQNGALAEKYLGCEGMEPGEFEKVLKETTNKYGGK